MEHRQEDVIDLHDEGVGRDLSESSDSDPEFSGFSSMSEKSSPGPSPRPRSKVTVVLPKESARKSSDKARGSSDKTKTKAQKSSDKTPRSSDKGKQKVKKKSKSEQKTKSQTPLFDITKLTTTDIDALRGILGISGDSQPDIDLSEVQYDGGDETEYSYDRDRSYYKAPIRVQIDAADISDSDIPEVDFSSALDDNNNDQLDTDWTLPKLKAPEFGDPVPENLAKLVNMACSKQCELDQVLNRYKVPANCEMASPPTVNQEVWKAMPKAGHLNDKLMVDIQNLVACGFGSVLKLTSLLKGSSMTPEIKKVISDILTLLGQTQYNLSIRRRYLIRPVLKRKYSALCNMSTAITGKLFGDHIDKEIKTCENQAYLGKDYYAPRGYSRGRGKIPPRRAGYTSYNQGRYHPYERHRDRGSYGPYRGRSRPMRRGASATATAPNEQE